MRNQEIISNDITMAVIVLFIPPHVRLLKRERQWIRYFLDLLHTDCLQSVYVL